MFGSSSVDAVEDRKITGLCQLLCSFYSILDSESQFLSPAAKAELPKLGARLVGLYSSLAIEAKRNNQKLWKLQPKLHLFIHLCEWQAISQGNPRYYWTYSDEDLAGKLQNLPAPAILQQWPSAPCSNGCTCPMLMNRH